MFSKKKTLILISSLLLFTTLKSQNHTCGFNHFVEQMIEQDSSYLEMVEYHEMILQNTIQGMANSHQANVVFNLPVVVHVINVGEIIGQESNISDTQINSALVDLNSAFGNASGQEANIAVNFCLAKRDPDGFSTNGIIRKNGSSVSGYLNSGITTSNESNVKNLSRWSNEEYFNIWIVSQIDGNASNDYQGRQGFGHFPGSPADLDGVVVLFNAFGTTGNVKPATDNNTTLIHEVGHSLFLYHTFRGDCSTSEFDCNQGNSLICPINTLPSEQGDRCADTHPHKRTLFNCTENLTNSCNGNTSNSNYLKNYMNYSLDECREEFTENQRERMRSILMGTRGPLTYSIGCEPPCPEVSVDFNLNDPIIPVNTNVTINSNTSGAISYSWKLNGIEICTTQNLTYTFDEGGSYDLCLFASSVNCMDRFCQKVFVSPSCNDTSLECEKVLNGNFDQINSNIDILDFAHVCGWSDKNRTPFFCATSQENWIGILLGSGSSDERVVSDEPLDLEIGSVYQVFLIIYIGIEHLHIFL